MTLPKIAIRLALSALALLGAATEAFGRPVLLISLDGLRPADVSDAAARGLKLPNLRRFLAEGSYADGVIGILPTVTYPSHTTLITGAAPARHGIVNNQTFDPTQINREGWYWYASDIKVPTLWDAAHGAHLSTGNIHWPVSVGARSIDWNLPQIWLTGHPDDGKLLAALASPGLIPALEAGEGPYAPGIDDSIAGDETRGRFAVRLIALHHPDFLTVYLTGLDTMQHHAGPDTPEAHAVLERLDAIVGKLVAAEQKAHPDAAVAVVSDHGFAPVNRALNLWRAFIDAGLVRGADAGPGHGGWKIAEWDAVPWISGGSIAVVLARPADPALKAKVADLLARLKSGPANGIAGIIARDAIAQAGGNLQADFYLNLADGVMALPWRGPDLPLVVNPAPYKGMHGYFPADPRMRSTFLVLGAGIAKGHDLGVIDMRSIAPTLAQLLGVKLAGAELSSIPLGVDTH
jgi:predicted AlkP superfamily pyrophosphatase or phosphodiesterase